MKSVLLPACVAIAIIFVVNLPRGNRSMIRGLGTTVMVEGIKSTTATLPHFEVTRMVDLNRGAMSCGNAIAFCMDRDKRASPAEIRSELQPVSLILSWKIDILGFHNVD